MTLSHETCARCGAAVAGIDGCFTVLAHLNARAHMNAAYGAVHLLVTDAHILQHVEDRPRAYLPFHLLRLCWLLEFGGHPGLHQERECWLGHAFNGLADVPMLQPPLERGALTVHDVADAPTPSAYAACVWAWAQSVWDAWSEHHMWARTWISERGYIPQESPLNLSLMC